MKLYNIVLTCIAIFIIIALVLFAAGAYEAGDYDDSYMYMLFAVIVLITLRLLWKGDKD